MYILDAIGQLFVTLCCTSNTLLVLGTMINCFATSVCAALGCTRILRTSLDAHHFDRSRRRGRWVV